MIGNLELDSLRAEITLFEAARAHAAADSRDKVTMEDIKVVAPMALRLRKSTFIDEYIADQSSELEHAGERHSRLFSRRREKEGRVIDGKFVSYWWES